MMGAEELLDILRSFWFVTFVCEDVPSQTWQSMMRWQVRIRESEHDHADTEQLQLRKPLLDGVPYPCVLTPSMAVRLSELDRHRVFQTV